MKVRVIRLRISLTVAHLDCSPRNGFTDEESDPLNCVNIVGILAQFGTNLPIENLTMIMKSNFVNFSGPQGYNKLGSVFEWKIHVKTNMSRIIDDLRGMIRLPSLEVDTE